MWLSCFSTLSQVRKLQRNNTQPHTQTTTKGKLKTHSNLQAFLASLLFKLLLSIWVWTRRQHHWAFSSNTSYGRYGQFACPNGLRGSAAIRRAKPYSASTWCCGVSNAESLWLLSMLTWKNKKCISRENPGHIDGNDVFYH